MGEALARGSAVLVRAVSCSERVGADRTGKARARCLPWSSLLLLVPPWACVGSNGRLRPLLRASATPHHSSNLFAFPPQMVAYNKMDVPDSSDYWEDIKEQLVAEGVPAGDIYAIR